MTKTIFYPLGNADCCVIKLASGKIFVFDYADMHTPSDPEDKRMPLKENFRQDIDWPNRKDIDVLAITHGDNDHLKGIPDNFWLEHAAKYQGNDRVKFKEMWVPAAMICDADAHDDGKIVRAEARHRFLNKTGIRVFARPEHLRKWVEAQGKKLEDFTDIITDAGRLVPGLSKEKDGIEFFVHSPFAERTAGGLLDRNENCLVMQATLRDTLTDTKFLITADSVKENWQRIVTITRKHGNEDRLAWDIFKIPHHGSYLSMADDKGVDKTEPTPEFQWLLDQGAEGCVMVCSSREVEIEGDPEDKLPPHRQTYRTYKETADSKDGELVVTMENPSVKEPKRTIVEVNALGATLKKEGLAAVSVITSSKAPRVG